MIRRLFRLLILLVVLAGLFVLATRLLQKTRTTDTTIREPAPAVDVSVDTGNVSVSAGATDFIKVHRTVRYSFRKPTLSKTVRNGALRLRGHCPGLTFTSCRVSYNVTVPPTEDVAVHASAGSVRVRGVVGKVDLQTSAGSVDVGSTQGPLRLSTSAGSISGIFLRSPTVRASTSAGSVKLRFTSAPESLTVSTSAGSVDVEVPDEVYRVDAHASAGSAHVEVRTDPDATRRITASTSAGSIRIHRGRAPS